MYNKMISIILISVLALFSYTAFAETNLSIGKPGDPSKISRTIKLTMLDNMFLPPEIAVSKGETIQFILINLGNNTHQLLIGMEDDLKKSANSKQKNNNLIRVNPTEQKELIWHFTDEAVIPFACPISTHFKTMRGQIIVKN